MGNREKASLLALWLAVLCIAGVPLWAGGGGEASGSSAGAGPRTIRVLPGAWSGNTIEFIRAEADAWAAKSGNKVEFASVPNSSTEVLALAQQYLGAGSTDIDIYPMDVVWPGLLGQYYLDLKPYFGADDLKRFDAAGLEANTVDGKLVGIPFYGDKGVLYYRTDLLQKAGYSAPPETWADLRQMAGKIMASERAGGRSSFWGHVFDGMAYEGLTCSALEWVYSHGGGTFVDANGNVTIDNPNAVAAYTEVTGWIGTICPPGVTSYKTEDARGVWQAGNSAFMRNWPYAYASGQSDDSPIKGRFKVAPLPHGPGGKSCSTLGGWQIAVSRFSRNKDQAAGLIKFLTSDETQKERMLKLSRTPVSPKVLADPEVAASTPWLGMYATLNAVARPSASTKTRYNEASTVIFTVSRAILMRETSPAEGVKRMAAELQRLKGTGW